MFRYSFIWCLMALSPVLLSGQNLFPNPGFELNSNCPNSLGDVDGHLNGWSRGNTATPDYASCGFTGNSSVRTTPRTGSGAIGMWGGTSHPSCTNSAYTEPIAANLTTPVVAGLTYDVSLSVRVDGSGTSTSGPNGCVDFGVYLFNSSSPPNSSSWCCHTVNPQWTISGSLIPQGSYATFSGSITPTGNFDRVLIGAFCNSTSGSGACGNYAATRMYFNLDDVLLREATILDAVELDLKGSIFPNFNVLQWELPEAAELQELWLERGLDQENFQRLYESPLGQTTPTFSYHDFSPQAGENYYRLSGIDKDGQQVHSNVILLQNALTEQGGKLVYGYDVLQEMVSFSVDAGDGGNFRLDVLDVSGRQVQSFDWQKDAGIQSFSFPVQGYASGIYMLRLQDLSHGLTWQNKLMKP